MKKRERFPIPIKNGIGLVPVPDPHPKTCTDAVVAQVRSVFFPTNDADRDADGDGEDDAPKPRKIHQGAILGGRASANAHIPRFVDLGIPSWSVGISRRHLKVMTIASTETGPRVPLCMMDRASPILIYEHSKGNCHRLYCRQRSIRIGDAITFASDPNVHFCLVGLVVPSFEVKKFVESNLKMLPYIVHWFDEAKNSLLLGSAAGLGQRRGNHALLAASARKKGSSDMDSLKLSAIYQFVLGEPMGFVPAPTKKRKRSMIGDHD